MEENEILEEIAPAEENAEAAEGEEMLSATEETGEVQGHEAPCPEENEGEGTAEEISAEGFAKTLANPMFAVFARGRSGGIEEAVRDFEKMIAAGRESLTEEMLMKMTPGAAESACGGGALSEQQRRIARQAGMSYREYYEIIRSIPTRTK